MRALLLGLCTLMMLSACQDMLEGGRRMNVNIEKNYVNASNKISDLFRVDRTPPPEPPPMPPRYCYRLQADVVCYEQPIAGKEDRLVGSQGTGAGIYESGTAYEAGTAMAPIVVNEYPPAPSSNSRADTPKALMPGF